MQKTDFQKPKPPKSEHTLELQDEEYVSNFLTLYSHKENFVQQVSQILDGEFYEFDEIEDGRYTNFYFTKLRLLDFCCCMFNLIGLGVTIINYDYEFWEINFRTSLLLLWICIWMTGFLIWVTILRYQVKLNWLKERREIPLNETLWTSKIWIELLIELFLISVIPLPIWIQKRVYIHSTFQDEEYQIYYHVNELLSLFMVLRFILIVRTILMHSKWYSNRTHRMCNFYSMHCDFMFVIRSLMREKPYTIIFAILFVCVFIFGYAIRICELPLSRNEENMSVFHNYFNAFWNVIITFSTVGYGDIYVRTFLGRLIIVIVIIFGVFIISLMVASFQQLMKLQNQERLVYQILEKIKLKEKMKKYAALILTVIVKIQFLKKKNQNKEKELNYLKSKFKKGIKKFKRTRTLYKAIKNDEQQQSEFDSVRYALNKVLENQEVMMKSHLQIMQRLEMSEVQMELLKQKLAKKTSFFNVQ